MTYGFVSCPVPVAASTALQGYKSVCTSRVCHDPCQEPCADRCCVHSTSMRQIKPNNNLLQTAVVVYLGLTAGMVLFLAMNINVQSIAGQKCTCAK